MPAAPFRWCPGVDGASAGCTRPAATAPGCAQRLWPSSLVQRRCGLVAMQGERHRPVIQPGYLARTVRLVCDNAAGLLAPLSAIQHTVASNSCVILGWLTGCASDHHHARHRVVGEPQAHHRLLPVVRPSSRDYRSACATLVATTLATVPRRCGGVLVAYWTGTRRRHVAVQIADVFEMGAAATVPGASGQFGHRCLGRMVI